MSERLTKADLLAGPSPEPFAVPALDGREVTLRPLSAPEAERVQLAQLSGLHLENMERLAAGPQERAVGQAAPRAEQRQLPKFDIDFSEVVSGTIQAQLLATHFGLVEPAMTLEEVGQVRPVQAIEQIGEEVMRRSGLSVNAQAQVRQFRDLNGRPADPAAALEREPAGGDAG